MPPVIYPFPTITKLASECGVTWSNYDKAVDDTKNAEEILIQVLNEKEPRLLDSDSSLVLCGSFARYEMVPDSDCDWTLLINGVVSNKHSQIARAISQAIEDAHKAKRGIKSPGTSGTFGNMSFSHDLVHRIGGGADSNANLTRRILMLLESRPVNLSTADSSRQVWDSVVRSILERYFEEDAHFSPLGDCKVPRFLFNDLTRYWRTIGVDYASKYLEQDGKKWAIRNAKLRMSRKLLYAAGMAFCFACQLDPQSGVTDPRLFKDEKAVKGEAAAPYIASAVNFAETPPLEYLASFVDQFITDKNRRRDISHKIFGAYNDWLGLLGDAAARQTLETLNHEDAKQDPVFQKVRDIGSEFASGLKLLFFNREKDEDRIAALSLNYVAF